MSGVSLDDNNQPARRPLAPQARCLCYNAGLMSAENAFPNELLLDEPDRRARLIREFYEQYGESRPKGYYAWGHQQEEAKKGFYREKIAYLGHDQHNYDVDIRCQGGEQLDFVHH